MTCRPKRTGKGVSPLALETDLVAATQRTIAPLELTMRAMVGMSESYE